MDLSNAFLQVPLDDQIKQYITINTHKGLFRYNHAPTYWCGICSIFFKHNIDSMLEGIKQASSYICDFVKGVTL